MAKITVPNTSGNQSQNATALGDDTIWLAYTTIKNFGTSTVWMLRQDTGGAPSCSTVIATGYPIGGASLLNAADGETIVLFDPQNLPKLSRVFAACSSGSSELRIF